MPAPPFALPLPDLPLGLPVRVAAITADPAQRRRLRELGMIDNASLTPLFRSPAGDPTAYAIRGATIALRDRDARLVLAYPEGEA